MYGAAAWVLGLAAGPAWAQQEEPGAVASALEVAAAHEGSSYFGWAAELAAATEGVTLLVQPTAGSVQNLQQLGAGRVDLAMVQADAAWHAWAGSGRLPQDDGLVALGHTYPELVHLLVRSDAGIESVADLSGVTVDVGGVGSGTLFNALDVLQAAGVEDAVLEFSPGILIERLVAGTLQAGFATTRAPLPAFLEAEGVQVLPLPADVLDALVAAPYYRRGPLPEAYGPGEGLFVDGLLVSHRSLEAAAVQSVLASGLVSSGPTPIPLHPAVGPEPPEALVTDFEPPVLPLLPPVQGAPTGDDRPVRYATVDDLVREALEHNAGVGLALLGTRQREASLRAQHAQFLPVLSAATGATDQGLSHGVGVGVSTPLGTRVDVGLDDASSALGVDGTWTADASLSVTQDLLGGAWLPANLAGVRGARIDVQLAAIAMEQAGLDLVARVQRSTYDLVASHARVALRSDQVDFAARHANRVRARAELGAADLLAVREAAEVKARAEEALLREQQQVVDLEDSLLSALQAGFGEHLVPLGGLESRLEGLEPSTEPEAALALALARRPDLRTRGLRLQRAQVDLAAQRRHRLPDLSVSGSVGTVSDGTDGTAAAAVGSAVASGQPYWSAGGALGITLGREADRHTLDRVALVVTQRQIELDDALQRAELEVRTSLRAIETADKRLEVARLGRSLAEDKLSLALDAFRAGTADSFKVLEYQEDYVDAEIRVLAATADYLKALSELERVQGTGLDRYRAVLDDRAEVTDE